LENLDGKRRIEVEEEERKKDFKKLKSKKEGDAAIPSHLLQGADPNQVTARKK
jgi:pre-mRNA-splicing factor CDC5/CEF1